MKYTLSTLEEFVVRMYRNLRIYDPDDITEENVCFIFRIYLKRSPVATHSVELGNFRAINLDSRMTIHKQREAFFHELAHLLRHSGRQTTMPAAFRELQEWDAHRFTLYAACPIHMLHLFDLKDPDIINEMSRRFRVTPTLCHERLAKIKEKMLKTTLNNLF